MSHFTVLVCLPKGTDLAEVDIDGGLLGTVLEPWNENTEVKPYRVYEEGGPTSHWAFKILAREGFLGKETSEDPGDHDGLTWLDFVAAHARRFPAEGYNQHGERELHYDAELDRAYHTSTYNPDSKWDWWSVGGRWRNSLLAKPTVDRSALRIGAGRHWTEGDGNNRPDGRDEATGGLYCDGGRVCDLDLDGMRAKVVRDETARYDAFVAAITPELLPETKPWSHFYGLSAAGHYDDRVAAAMEIYEAELAADAATAGTEVEVYDDTNDPLGIKRAARQRSKPSARDFARAEYRAQLGIQKLDASEDFKYWSSCPVAHFALGREEYIARKAANFLPGYAMVTLDGEWRAAGEMGWWGMGSDTEGTEDAHKGEMRAYLDSIDPETVVVLVDCHI